MLWYVVVIEVYKENPASHNKYIVGKGRTSQGSLDHTLRIAGLCLTKTSECRWVGGGWSKFGRRGRGEGYSHRAPGLHGEGRCPLPHCCLLYSEFPNSQCGPLSTATPVHITYVMEAEVLPHTQCLWFQVRNHAILGLMCCVLPITVNPLLQGAPGLGPGCGAVCDQATQGYRRDSTAGLFWVPLFTSTFNSSLYFSLSPSVLTQS